MMKRDKSEILNRLKHDFECLYNDTDTSNFNSEHYNQTRKHKSNDNISDPLYS
jgi:hypothetical protein